MQLEAALRKAVRERRPGDLITADLAISRLKKRGRPDPSRRDVLHALARLVRRGEIRFDPQRGYLPIPANSNPPKPPNPADAVTPAEKAALRGEPPRLF